MADYEETQFFINGAPGETNSMIRWFCDKAPIVPYDRSRYEADYKFLRTIKPGESLTVCYLTSSTFFSSRFCDYSDKDDYSRQEILFNVIIGCDSKQFLTGETTVMQLKKFDFADI